jgi:hypothetical protein
MTNYFFFKDFGKITSSSNFSKNNNKNIRLSFDRNKNDGSLRLYKQFNLKDLKPTRRIFFKEPQFHLNFISKVLKEFNTTNIFTFSYKDQSLANMCKNRNSQKKIHFLSTFLKINFFSNIDEILNKLFSKNKIKIKKNDNLIILRHVWEHIRDHKKLLEKIFYFCSNKSVFYIEVPDSYRQIKSLDYSVLWEDHIYYFDKIGFVNSLSRAKLKVLRFYKFKQNYEDIYCAVCIFDQSIQYKIKKSPKMLKYTTIFKNSFNVVKKTVIKNFINLHKNGKIIAFGASHMLNTYVNLFCLEKYFSYVVDDSLIKQNMFMFSNGVNIVPFSKISSSFPKTCIVSINPSNKQIRNKIKYLKSNGVKIKSIFK